MSPILCNLWQEPLMSNPSYTDTDALAAAAKAHGNHGKVSDIHCASVAAGSLPPAHWCGACLARRAAEIAESLRSRLATLEAEAARTALLVEAAEAYRDVCAPVKGSDVAAAELTGYLEADEALIAAALALPVRP